MDGLNAYEGLKSNPLKYSDPQGTDVGWANRESENDPYGDHIPWSDTDDGITYVYTGIDVYEGYGPFPFNGVPFMAHMYLTIKGKSYGFMQIHTRAARMTHLVTLAQLNQRRFKRG